MALPVKKQSSSSSSSSSSDDNKNSKPKYMMSAQPIQGIQQTTYVQQPQQVVYQQGSTLNQLPVGVTEEQVRRSLAGVSLDIVKGEVRQEYIPLTRVETEYKEEVQYEKVPRQVKVTDYYQVEYQQEQIPQVYQHTITEYVPLQKIIPIVQYKAVEKTYTRPEIMQGDVRVEQGAAEIVSSQIIQTESQAYQSVAFPQVQAGMQTQVLPGMQTQYVNQMAYKKKSSSSSSSDGKQKKFIYSQAPQQIQYQQVSTMPQPITTSYKHVAAAPIAVQQPMQVQTIGRSMHYAQPVQQMPVQQMPVQQMPYVQQGVVPQQQVLQPGMQMSNFQGVRLADSHILMK